MEKMRDVENRSAYHFGQIAALERVVQILISASHPQIRDGICSDLESLQPTADFPQSQSENKSYENGFVETIRKIQKRIEMS